MKLRLLTLLFLSLLFSCIDEAPKTESPNNKISEVETNLIPSVYIEGDSTWTIEERMEHYGVPGVSIAVINKGAIAWVKTYGIMDKESKAPVTKNTLFQAASISKPVSAYGALKLVEQGKIDLTKDINSQLTSWKLAENEFTTEKKVSLKNLLNHSAGTTVHGFLGYSPDLPVPTLIQVLNGTTPANSNAIIVDKTPEESFRYSGGGYNIVQQLMIDVEGKPFPEIMKEQVLQPLGMQHSSFNQPLGKAQLEFAATGYLPDGSMTKGKRHTYPEMAAAGLWTTSEDLAKFAINIQKTLRGDSSAGLSKELTTKMLTPFVEDFIGLGIFINKKKDQVYFGHGGWNEGFSSELIAHKEKGYGVVVMINSNHPDFISELVRSVALTYEWADYVPRYKKLETDGDLISEFTGRYMVRGYDFLEVSEVNDQLMYKDGPEEDFVNLIKVTDSTYVVRDFDVLFQFKKNVENDSINLHVINSSTLETRSTYSKISEDTRLPLEMLISGDLDQALKTYKSLMEKDENDPAVNENNLNNLGYRFLGKGKNKVAKDIFEVNMLLYPESFNVYDSYAEACMELGENDLAIEYYQKSLNLNPKNDNAKNQIEKLERKK
ncbi:MAG: serine hydrolase [Chitinophagales bacterium]|nr:serine hydrolase [Chitinophagales bacterium]